MFIDYFVCILYDLNLLIEWIQHKLYIFNLDIEFFNLDTSLDVTVLA